MKSFHLLVFVSLGLLWLSCDPYEEDKLDIGGPPNPTFEILPGDTPNDFILMNTTPETFLTQWDLDGTGTAKGTEAEVYFPFKGTYDITMTTFNKGGHASASQPLIVSQDDPNACYGNFFLLTGCNQKIWRVAPEASAMHIGPNLNDTWWGNSEQDITTRSCHFNDRYIFRANGEFEYDAMGDFWADDDGSGNIFPPELAISIGCHPESDWPEDFKAWGSGIHAFNITNTTLTIIGEGAWIGLYKVGTTGEVGVPQLSVTYNILEITDNRMVIYADYGWGIWRFTLITE